MNDLAHRSARPTTPLRVLIIEDSEDDTLLLQRELVHGGFDLVAQRVDAASEMQAALAAQEWDVILADYLLPGFGVPQALAILQAAGLDIPLIVVSGVIGEETAVEMMKAGAVDYIMKDRMKRLVPAIHREIQEAAVRRDRRQAEAALRASEERLALALESGKFGTWDYDLVNGNYLATSDRCKANLGLPPEAVLSRADVLQIIHPQDRERVRTALSASPEQHCDYAAEYRVVWPDGTVRWISARGTLIYDDAGRPCRMIGTTQDITERRLIEDEKARLSDYNRLLLESTAEGIYGVDLSGRCTFINTAGTQLIGYPMQEAVGQNLHTLTHHTRSDGSTYPVEQCPIYLAFRQGLPCHVETEVFWRQDGTSFPVSYSAYPITSAGRVIGAVVTFRDITERKRVEEEKERYLLEAQARADRDPLTELLNHRVFQRKLEEEAARAERENSTLAVVMLDLDNFKFFNDAYGHAVGDRVLRKVARRLQTLCGPQDTVARFGGDEFALLLPCVGETSRREIEARLQTGMAGLTFCPEGQPIAIPITICFGIALFPFGNLHWHEVVDRADERLRRAKTGGSGETEADEVRMSALNALEGFSMLDALVTAVDNKDRYTRRHSEDVLSYSLMIAREIGFSEPQQQTVAISALLHDVGKIGVPDAILRKPGKLTEQEFEAIKQHPQMGAIMVAAVPGLEATLDAVRHHHERWDGGGYPFGLRGEETPLIARLMAVADAFSAMTTDRPYRGGMDRAKALSILHSGAGSQWDPACVEAFAKALARVG